MRQIRFRFRGQWSPRSLAAGLAASYVVLMGLGSVVLINVPVAGTAAPSDTASVALPTYTGFPGPATGSRSSPATTTSATVSFVLVTGGGDITTEIPRGWSSQALSPTVREATDPFDSRRLVRYGGAPPTAAGSLLDRIEETAQATGASRDGYRQLRLATASFRGAEAVTWEFQFTNDAGTRLHCYGHYWMADGVEYVLYAQSTPSDWEATRGVLQHMISSAGPVS